jgi:hypothetical protein
MQSSGDPHYREWFAKVKSAWLFLDANGRRTPTGKQSDLPPYADYGAEAEYTLLDEEIHAKFDNDTRHHAYSTMNAEQILGKLDPKTGAFVSEGQYRADLRATDEYDQRLKHVGDAYHSVEFAAASLARRGSLYDSMRSALYLCVGPRFTSNLIPTRLNGIIQQMSAAGLPSIAPTILSGWVNKRAREMEGSDQVMVRYYAQAVQLAQVYDVPTPAVTRAITRLGILSDPATELGEGPHPCAPDRPNGVPDRSKQCGIAPYHDATADPTDATGTRKLVNVAPYTPGLYVRLHVALPGVLPGNGLAPPRPPDPSSL